MDQWVGRTVSHYRILERLGGGGMGVVYRAEDTRLRRPVALKFLPADLTGDETAKRRFMREARAASALDHPAICSIHAIDTTADGQLFICMACYDGETLDSRLQQQGGALTCDEAVRIVGRIAEGLAVAHAAGIVHRDVKPANIMLTRDGRVKILDFGLATLRGTTQLTRSDSIVGTVAYMAPEQIRGDEIDARSDLFSLGVVFYELLTGRQPFTGEREATVMYQIAHLEPAPLADHRADLPPAVQAVVDKLLHKDPALRYQNADQLRDDLERLICRVDPVWARRRRHRLRVALVTAASVIAVTAILAARGVRLTAVPAGGDGAGTAHVAVLPLENLSGEAADQAFADGLTEALTTQIALSEQFQPTLWVVPSSEVRRQNIDGPAAAHRKLGVNLVLTGSVQRFGGRIQVTLNLIDPTRGDVPRQISGRVIETLAGQLAGLHERAVFGALEMMNVKLQPAGRQRLLAGGTAVAAAYTAYLEGVGYLQAYGEAGNLDRAIASFVRALDLDDRYALAHASLGEAYWRRYRDTLDARWIADALRHCDRAVELDRFNAPALVTVGMIRSGTGDAPGAIAAFELALTLDPASDAAYRGLAAAYALQERFAEAEATYRRAIAMKPDYWVGYHEFGQYCYRRGDHETAAEQFRKVVALNPGNAYGHLNLGTVLWVLGRPDEAAAMFRRSLAAEPNYRAYNNLSIVLYMQHQYAEAAAACEQALVLNDTSYRTWATLGNASYWLPGRREAALEAFARAAALAEQQRQFTPRDAWLLTSLAGYYAILGQGDRARPLIAEALQIAPADARVAYFAGHAYEQLGDREQALAWIDQALQNGYSRSDVQNDPFLEELRRDRRFR